MRSKRVMYNIVSQLIHDIIVFICGLILPKLILSNYGSEYNGIISSITQFLEYISILTLGVSGATRVAIYKAKGDIYKISGVLKSTENFMRKIAVIFIGYTILLSIVFPFIIQSNIEIYKISLLVIIIGIAVFSEYFFGITYVAFVSAMQCRYIYNIILIIVKVLSTLLSIFLIKIGKDIELVKFVGAICLAMGPILLSIIINKKYNIIKNIEPDDSALNQRKDVMAHSIANCVHQYTDVFLLTFFSTAKVVSVYSIYTLVLSGIKKVETIFTNGLEGTFGEIWAKNEIKTFKNNFDTFEFLVFVFISVVFSCTTFLLLPFIKLYTKNVTDINYVIPLFAFLSILSYAFYCLRTPYLICVQAAGKYKETKKGAILEATLNFVISLVLIFPFGIIGITIGTLFANLFRTIQYELFVSKNLVQRSNIIFIKKIIWLLCCFLIIILVVNILPQIEINSWINWLYSGVYYFFISSIITMIMALLFYKKQCIVSIQVFKKMLFKRKKVY